MYKNSIITLLIIGFMFFTGCSSSSETSKKENENFEARDITPPKIVKNVDATYRDYVKKNKIAELEKLKIDFDTKGNLINQEKTSAVKFDRNGFKTETLIYGEDNNVISKYTYRYNNSGLRTETIKYNSSGKPVNKFIYEYNRFGNKTKSVRFDMNGNMEEYYIYEYDDGNLVEETWYNNLDQVVYRIKHLYDDENKKIKTVTYNEDGDINYKYFYRYDNDGNIIEEEKLDQDNNKVGVIQYIYKYY